MTKQEYVYLGPVLFFRVPGKARLLQQLNWRPKRAGEQCPTLRVQPDGALTASDGQQVGRLIDECRGVFVS